MKTAVTTLFTCALLFISVRSFTNSGGPPAALTNAPGEGSCTQCHGTGSLVTSGSVYNGMSLSVVGATLNTLQKNTTYTFNLTFSDPASEKYGFELCVLQAGANASTGSLGTLVSTTPSTQLISGGNRSYLEHTSAGNVATGFTKTWTFQWQSPVTYTGGATFYVVVNSTDEDGGTSPGDVIYAKTFAATVILPVSWLYTKAETDKDGATINWATASEKNNWKFEVEKSTDQKEWSTLGEVKGMGNATMVNRYRFKDEKLEGTAYYRVKQVDFNGAFSYSDMVTVTNKADMDEPAVVYHADQNVYMVKGNNIQQINITNMNGETVFNANGNVNEIPSLKAGIYLVQIQTATQTSYQKILMH